MGKTLAAKIILDGFSSYSDSKFSVVCRVCLGLESPQDELSAEDVSNTQPFCIISQMGAADTLTLVPFQD